MFGKRRALLFAEVLVLVQSIINEKQSETNKAQTVLLLWRERSKVHRHALHLPCFKIALAFQKRLVPSRPIRTQNGKL